MRPTSTGRPAPATVEPAPAPTSAVPDSSSRRHCWVQGPPECAGPWPGVVVEWRRADDGWLALVTYVVTEPTGSTTIHAWLAAHLLTPIA